MDGKPIIQQFQDDLYDIVDKYRDQGITVGETIGVFELIKLDIWYDNVKHEDPLDNPSI